MHVGFKTNDLFAAFFESALMKKEGYLQATTSEEDDDGKKIKANAEKSISEAAIEAKEKVEKAFSEEQKVDVFVNEEEKAKKEEADKIDASNKSQAVDKDWIKLIQQYQTLFGDNSAKTAEEIKIAEEIANIKSGVIDVKYGTASGAVKAANAAILNNKIEDATKKLEEAKKQADAKIQKENEKSIAEDKNKEPEINPFIDSKDNPYYNSAKNVFDIEEDEVAVGE